MHKKSPFGLSLLLFYQGLFISDLTQYSLIVVFYIFFDPFQHFFMRNLRLLECITEEHVWRSHRNGLMQTDAISFRSYFRNIGDKSLWRLIGFGVNSIFGHGDDIGLIFDFELERPPLQTIGDEIAPYTAGSSFARSTFRMSGWILWC